MKRFVIMLILLIIIMLFVIFGKEEYYKFKKRILHIDNYVKVYYSYVGKKEEIQEVNGIYLEKEKYNDGYIINTNEVVSLSNGTVVFKGVMDDKKTILIMNEYCTYKYQNIDEYKCSVFQSINAGDVIASSNGSTYYEVQSED